MRTSEINHLPCCAEDGFASLAVSQGDIDPVDPDTVFQGVPNLANARDPAEWEPAAQCLKFLIEETVDVDSCLVNWAYAKQLVFTKL